jgi:hypothetical protein
MIAPAQDSWMASWPDHLSSGNQKRFWRDPVKRIGAAFRAVKLGVPKLLS